MCFRLRQRTAEAVLCSKPARTLLEGCVWQNEPQGARRLIHTFGEHAPVGIITSTAYGRELSGEVQNQ